MKILLCERLETGEHCDVRTQGMMSDKWLAVLPGVLPLFTAFHARNRDGRTGYLKNKFAPHGHREARAPIGRNHEAPRAADDQVRKGRLEFVNPGRPLGQV